MEASEEPQQKHEPSLEEEEPVRDKYSDLVEEGRIAGAGGGVLRLSPVFQAFLYLILVSAILFAIYWAWRRG